MTHDCRTCFWSIKTDRSFFCSIEESEPDPVDVCEMDGCDQWEPKEDV